MPQNESVAKEKFAFGWAGRGQSANSCRVGGCFGLLSGTAFLVAPLVAGRRRNIRGCHIRATGFRQNILADAFERI